MKKRADLPLGKDVYCSDGLVGQSSHLSASGLRPMLACRFVGLKLLQSEFVESHFYETGRINCTWQARVPERHRKGR
jgi:hypothetical protein